MLIRALPVVLLAATPCMAVELYRQNPVPNGFGGYSSQDARNPGGLGWFSEVADNFPGQAGWDVGQVEFWGGYVTDIPGNTHGFSVRFYQDSDGSVGPLLLAQDVMDFDEDEYYSTVITGLGTVRGYHYTLNLGSHFVVPTDGQYWVSVVAILDRGGSSNEPQWGWAQSTAFSAPSCLQRFFSPTFNPQGVDVSFALSTGPTGPTCDSIDFNGDGLFPDTQDITDFLTVFAGGVCAGQQPGDIPCNTDVDFNNDTLFPDVADIQSLLTVFAGGTCE